MTKASVFTPMQIKNGNEQLREFRARPDLYEDKIVVDHYGGAGNAPCAAKMFDKARQAVVSDAVTLTKRSDPIGKAQ